MDVNQKINVLIEFKAKWDELDKAEKRLSKLRDEFAGGMVADTFDKSIDNIQKEKAELVAQQQKARQEIEKTAKTKEKADKKGTKDAKKSAKEVSNAIADFSVTLPLLFGFQQLSKGIGSLIDPAMDLLQVNQLEQQFLAIKYLPTAEKQLNKVLDMADGWDAQSESQREAEGDMLLFTKQISDAISYTAQLTMTYAALGEAIPLVGRNMGAATGLAIGLSTSMLTLSSETGQVISYFQGMDAAVALTASDMAGQMMDSLNMFKPNIVDTKDEVDTLIKSLELIPRDILTKISVDLYLNNPQLWQYLQDEAAKAGKTQYLPTPAVVKTEAAKTTPTTATINAPTNEDINKAVGSKILDEKNKYDSMLDKAKNWGTVGALAGFTIGLPFGGVGGIIGGAIGGVAGFLGGIGAGLLGFQEGGIVPGSPNQAIPIMAHGGETIIPAGESLNNQVTINITASVSSDYDVRRLADQLSKYWVNDMERVSKARGII
jgi:hypothetical protein